MKRERALQVVVDETTSELYRCGAALFRSHGAGLARCGTGPKYRSSQSRTSRTTSSRGGTCPAFSNSTYRLCSGTVPTSLNSTFCDVSTGNTKSYRPDNIRNGILIYRKNKKQNISRHWARSNKRLLS